MPQTPAVDGASSAPGSSSGKPGFDRVKAGELLERCLEQSRGNAARRDRDRQDYYNLNMYRGGERQWDIWDPNSQRMVPRGTDPEMGGIPGYVPRNTSNHYAVKIDGVSAILDQTVPAKECQAGTSDEKDRAAAEVAESALPTLSVESGYERDRAQIHKLVTLTSVVGYSLYYDNDKKYGMDAFQAHQCTNPNCAQFFEPADVTSDDPEEDGLCPECDADTAPAIHPITQQPVMGPERPVGKLCGKVHHSFEVSIPTGARTIDTKRLPWVLGHTRVGWSDVFGRFPTLKEQLQANGQSKGSAPATVYADAVSGLVAPGGGHQGATSAPDGPIVYEFWHDPIDDGEFSFPDGVYMVRVDETVAEAGPLLYTDENGRPFKNVLLRQFQAAPGVASGKPPADDLCPLQVQRNVVSSLIDLALMQFAAPREYVPLSVTLVDEPTGAPGERVRYRSTVPGEKPTIADGHSPAAGLYERLKGIDDEMDQVSRLNAVLAGERPAGDPTLGEVQRLEERGMAAFRAPLDELLQFEEDLSRMMLRIAAQTMWTERFYQVRGDNGAWDVQAFLGSDLDGRVDIYIDRASAWPKSPALHAQRRAEAIKAGLVNVQDPEVADTLLSEMNLANLKPSLDKDRKQIARELDRWQQAETPQEIRPPNPITQNLQRHFVLKQSWMKTEEAERLQVEKPEVHAAMVAHLQQIQMLLAPPPMAPSAAPAPGAKLDELTKGGVLTPKAGETGKSVSDLTHVGVLKPKPPVASAPQGAARG